jgi:hypothetical protein
MTLLLQGLPMPFLVYSQEGSVDVTYIRREVWTSCSSCSRQHSPLQFPFLPIMSDPHAYGKMWSGNQMVLNRTCAVKKSSEDVFWDVMLCSLIEVHLHFRGICYLHLQGKRENSLKHWRTSTRLHSITSQSLSQTPPWELQISHEEC